MITKSLLTIIYSLLIISILSSRALREKEENPHRKVNDKDSQDEVRDKIEKNDKEETDFSKISSSLSCITSNKKNWHIKHVNGGRVIQ